MTARSAQAYLWDARNAATSAIALAEGKTLSDYVADEQRRWAIERLMITIGEALRNALDFAPSLVDRFPDVRTIIAFRNRVVHGYFDLDNEIVWGILQNDVPVLLEQLQTVLTDSPPDEFIEP